MSSKKIIRFFVATILIALTATSLNACEAFENQLKTDRTGGMEKQDYRDALAPRDIEPAEQGGFGNDSTIPHLKPYISQTATQRESMPLVSISVNRSVPLRDIFYQLAQQSGYDIELDPRIRGSIIFSASERPLDQVVERISEMAGLRYKMEDRRLRVELDTPYNQTYKIDYISYIRTNSSSISTDVSVVSGEGADTGSTFSTSAESTSDFWGELDTNLQLILANQRDSQLRTESDPSVTVQQQNVNVRPVGVPDENGNIQVSPPDAVINVESLPEEQDAGSGQGGGAGGTGDVAAQFVINRQAGLISVFASQATHKEVAEYLSVLKKSVTAQVLIEAKVMEVSLTDSYSSGIDWSALHIFSPEINIDFATSAGGGYGGSVANNLPPGADTSSAGFAFGYLGNDIEAIVKAISQFGTAKALASPRLVVVNNQAAVLNVAKNRVYFEFDVDIEPGEEGRDPIVTLDPTIKSVPEGVLLNVMPSINLEKRTVSLALRPTVTKISSFVLDPSVAFNGVVGIENRIPEVDVQEIDTVMNVSSGQAVVLGGLMQDSTTSTEDGVPVLSEIPGFGNLFKTHSDTVSKKELVIFLKATILTDPSDAIDNADRDLYRKFSEDRRPFKM